MVYYCPWTTSEKSLTLLVKVTIPHLQQNTTVVLLICCKYQAREPNIFKLVVSFSCVSKKQKNKTKPRVRQDSLIISCCDGKIKKKGVCESLQFAAGSDGGLMLETSALKFLAVANLHYQLS